MAISYSCHSDRLAYFFKRQAVLLAGSDNVRP